MLAFKVEYVELHTWQENNKYVIVNSSKNIVFDVLQRFN